MNVTFNVGTLFDCNKIENLNTYQRKYESLWRQTLTGCKVLRLLQEIFYLPVTYVVRGNESNLTYQETRLSAYPQVNDTIDIYTRPMAIWSKIVKDVYPVHEIITWRYGFILRRPDTPAFEPFYSLPFTQSVWNCLYVMIFISTLLFYLLSKWEKHVVGGKWESTFIYELLVIISAHCQQYLHRKAILSSRRLAYFTLFLFSYVIYSFYTANLLSNLVNEENETIDLEELIGLNYQFAELENTKKDLSTGCTRDKMEEHWSYVKVLNTSEGLEAVRTSKTALLSDYVPLYPLLKKTFKPEEICQLAEVDLYTNVKKYLFTSKNFPLKDQLKTGILRAKESGILRRLLQEGFDTKPRCDMLRQVHTQFLFVFNPLAVLVCAYMLAVLVLLVERVHYSRSRVWPYVE